ncbi:Putative ATP-dependent endonuclease (OLD family protein) [Neorhizobium galegae bv. orientalis]|nr:Putative ATP-dependent endonuclease (OLD family protein) [Neorhizobium galegae bv. orientalis]
MTPFIDVLEVEGYKCFDQLRVPLGQLTLFTGLNGAGKSTALQPLLLLAQAARLRIWGTSGLAGELPLNGELVKLGSAGDVIRVGQGARATRFTIGAGSEVLSLDVSARAGDRALQVNGILAAADTLGIIGRLERLTHLSAVRSGPLDAFPIPDRSTAHIADVGVDGRFASYWYHQLADTDVPLDRCFPQSSGTSFRRQIDIWLDYLAPGANANVQSVSVASVLALQFRLSEAGEWRRPANVGYGLTYAFPILVALLAAQPGDVLVIDSPEAHLHPQAQSRMGRMLATFAAAGVQLLVETHSDHVLNGARLAVRDRIIDAEDLGLLFFAGASSDSHGVTSPRLDRDGRIDEWPEGFFDQGDKDVSRLAGWD